MKAVIQRVQNASVKTGGIARSSIGPGLLVLVGIENDDLPEDAVWLSKKTAGLRIFDDETGVMNLDVIRAGGEIMVISQFTLHAQTRRGNRPSYMRAAPPEKAVPLYNLFISQISSLSGIAVKTGVFGAEMAVELTNDGPVTIIIDTKEKE